MTAILAKRPGFLGPVIYQVFVNGIPYSNRPPILDAELTQTFGQHDLFTLRMEFPPNFPISQLTIWPDNTPVSIRWGQDPDLHWWYGYVNHHTISSNADSSTRLMQLSYTCIGTSSVLNSVQTRKWEQVSVTYIAKNIAAANGFRAVTNPNNWLLDFEQQASESDFQFLNRMANKCGMRFWCSGGTLYMISPVTALEGGGQSAIPVFYIDKTLTYQDTCRNFSYVQGTNLPGSVQANRAIYGIDAVSGKPFAAANTNKATSRVALKTTTSTISYTDAKNRIDAWAARAQFWIGAEATLYGNTHLYPGKVVKLTGSALPSNSAGFWLLSSATHKMTSAVTASPYMDRYLVEVIMLKNQASSKVTLSNITPVIPEFITCTLSLSGRWTSSNLAVVSVA